MSVTLERLQRTDLPTRLAASLGRAPGARPRVWHHSRHLRSVGYIDRWHDMGGRYHSSTAGNPNGLLRHSSGSTKSGRPGVDFDGTNDYMNPGAGFAHAGTAHTLIVVGDQQSTGSALKYFLDASSGRLIFAQQGNANYPSYYDGAWRDATSYPAIAGVQILEFVLNASTGIGKIRRNGVTIQSAGYSPKALNGTVRWMVHNGASGSNVDGLQHELIYWDRALSDRELHPVRSVLAAMYGIRSVGA